MLILLSTLALVGCLNQDNFDLRWREADCRKRAECDNVVATYDMNLGECYDEAAYQSDMGDYACQKKYCEFDADRAQDCLASVKKLECGSIADNSWVGKIDCDVQEIYDCTDHADDVNACLEGEVE